MCQWWSPHPVCCSICQRGTRLRETQILPRPHLKTRAPSTAFSSGPSCLLLPLRPPNASLSSHQTMLASLNRDPQACIYSFHTSALAASSSRPTCFLCCTTQRQSDTADLPVQGVLVKHHIFIQNSSAKATYGP